MDIWYDLIFLCQMLPSLVLRMNNLPWRCGQQAPPKVGNYLLSYAVSIPEDVELQIKCMMAESYD